MLRDAACDIARHLRGEPAQAFRPEGTPNAKPAGRHHMCSHKWRVVHGFGMVYMTLIRHNMHRGRRMPYVFLQGARHIVELFVCFWCLCLCGFVFFAKSSSFRPYRAGLDFKTAWGPRCGCGGGGSWAWDWESASPWPRAGERRGVVWARAGPGAGPSPTAAAASLSAFDVKMQNVLATF